MSEAPASGRRLKLGAPRHRRSGLSIQSLLLIMMLIVSVLSNVVIGAIGYFNGTDSLRDAATARVMEVRDARARGIVDLFETIENSMLVHSRGEGVIGAAEAFSGAFKKLDNEKLSAVEDAALDAYYTDVFGPRLSEADGMSVDVSAFRPTKGAQRYLQAHYTAPTADFDAALAVDDAGDGSEWSAAHARYHDYFRRMVNQLDYRDILLINPEGDVVYSAYKGVDLGTDLMSGPYRLSNLATAFTTAMGEGSLDSVVFTDFESYRPSIGTPAAWGVSLISRNGVVVGALAVEMPIDRITRVMTGGGDWEDSGLGQTGEAYLVGQDGLMRSPSRLLLEDPGAYAVKAAERGLDRSTIDRAVASGTTLMLQPASTEASEEAQLGRTGTIVASDYLGVETIVAYAPVGAENLGWAVVAKVDTAEAFAPVNDFTTKLLISSAIMVVFVSILSLILAQVLVRPLHRLQDAAQRIADGEDGVEVDAGRADELVAVANAFNDMSRSLTVKNELLEGQRRENERLLLSFMPEALAQRYREGATDIAQDHEDAGVVYVDIVGFEAYSRRMDSEHSLAVLNELVKNFDQAADRFGVERVRTTRQGYLAGCGLSVPRIDAARRLVEFAQELTLILDRYNGQNGTELELRAGIDMGTVTSGLIGREHVAFDLWGEAAQTAVRIQAMSRETGVFVTETVREKLGDSGQFVDAGTINAEGDVIRVWKLERI